MRDAKGVARTDEHYFCRDRIPLQAKGDTILGFDTRLPSPLAAAKGNNFCSGPKWPCCSSSRKPAAESSSSRTLQRKSACSTGVVAAITEGRDTQSSRAWRSMEESSAAWNCASVPNAARRGSSCLHQNHAPTVLARRSAVAKIRCQFMADPSFVLPTAKSRPQKLRQTNCILRVQPVFNPSARATT